MGSSINNYHRQLKLLIKIITNFETKILIENRQGKMSLYLFDKDYYIVMRCIDELNIRAQYFYVFIFQLKMNHLKNILKKLIKI